MAKAIRLFKSEKERQDWADSGYKLAPPIGDMKMLSFKLGAFLHHAHTKRFGVMVGVVRASGRIMILYSHDELGIINITDIIAAVNGNKYYSDSTLRPVSTGTGEIQSTLVLFCERVGLPIKMAEHYEILTK